MDVVVVDIPPVVIQFLGSKLGGSLHVDMTYATISLFDKQFTRLYIETRLEFTVSDMLNLNNYPLYIVYQDLGNCILSIDDDLEECTEKECTEKDCTEKEKIEKPNKDVYNTGF
jgi:hypothetical protein